MSKPEPTHESLFARYWPALLIGATWLWIFWPVMTGEKVIGFRDSAYLYYPLFKWIDAQWAAGEIPLWNPFCNFGMPVVADGTSSVFYPGKLVFFCRFLSYPARYGIYLAMHVPLAAAGAYWFSRTLRANRGGSTLAAFSFAFGGSVLFQVTNVIYLVSAAWLPFALCCVWKMIVTGQLRWAVAAGVACALMILGGDPQMVYHVGLIAVATVAGQFFRRFRRRRKALHPIGNSEFLWLTVMGSRVAAMIVVTCVLAAIQLLPTFGWSRLSERTNLSVPANVYQAWAALERNGDVAAVEDALLGDPTATAEHSYQFSQPPWSLLELFWPNFSGKPFPRHQRWTSGLAGADRVWVPSLYAGLVTVLWGVLGFRFWGRKRKQVWLTFLFFFFMLGSFGWYGFVWLAIETFPALGGQTQLGPQVGGLYWLMNMLLPQYFSFRYPAKLFLVASLALSVLAGVNFRAAHLRRVLWAILGFGSLTLCGLVGFNSLVESWMADMVPDSLFGPFDLAGASDSFRASLVQSFTIGASSLVLVLAIQRLEKHATENRSQWIQRLSTLLVVIAALDITISNRWLVPVIDASVFENANPVATRLEELHSAITGAEPLRVYRSTFDHFEPVAWERQSSEQRLAEIVAWQRETLHPKHHLGENVVLLGSFSSIWPATYQAFLESFEWYRQDAGLANGNQSIILKMFHGSFEINDNGVLEIKAFQPKLAVGSALPIDWMFEFDPLTETSGTRHPRCLWREDSARTMTRSAERDCRIIEFENNRFVAQVSTDRPQVLAYFAPVDHGWKVKVKNLATGDVRREKLIELNDWLLSGGVGFINTFLLPFPSPGQFEVEFVYRPREFWMGAWLSGCSWSILGFGMLIGMWRKRPVTTGE